MLAVRELLAGKLKFGLMAVAIGLVVIGVFFYITTLHKTGQFAALKALGASSCPTWTPWRTSW